MKKDEKHTVKVKLFTHFAMQCNAIERNRAAFAHVRVHNNKINDDEKTLSII